MKASGNIEEYQENPTDDRLRPVHLDPIKKREGPGIDIDEQALLSCAVACTLGTFSCTLPRNFVATQVVRIVAWCNMP